MKTLTRHPAQLVATPLLLAALVACDQEINIAEEGQPTTATIPLEEAIGGRGGNGNGNGNGNGQADDLRDDLLNRGIRAIPAAPPVSEALFTLGQALSFDPILSGNRDIACLSCHHPTVGTDDDLNLPEGVDGVTIPRNAPPLFNLHAQPSLFWDNAVRQRQDGSLITPAGDQLTDEMQEVLTFGVVAAQAMFPVTSREEMRGQVGDNELANLADDDFTGIWAGIMTRLRANAIYRQLFREAYPETPLADMTFAHAANAIAGFEIAAFESRQSPFERFLAGDDAALDDDQRDGARAFMGARCDQCHRGAGLSDFQAHNTGLTHIGPGLGDGPSGREDFGTAGNGANRYAFRTPPLTNTTLTGPWGHAGQYDDLRRFLDHYTNAAQELRDYNVNAEIADPFIRAQRFAGADDDIIDQLDPLLRGNQRQNTGDILTFMEALEDPNALDLDWTVPAAVPSGLPVAP